MVAFVLSANTNIDALTAKVGGDTYDTNGFTLTIDQDSRNGLNQNTSASIGSMTVNASKGGSIELLGTGIWMIPYTAGAGNVPAWNTVITNGTGTGKLIGVHSALTAASTATGVAMPATGFIRVKQTSGAYIAGALTGISATASDAGRIGWLEIVGDEAGTINANRLAPVNITGAWYAVGTTNAIAGQTMQLPNSGLLRYAAGVFIEKTVGSNDFEFYPNAGTVVFATTVVGIANDVDRGKVVWITNAGLVTIGNGGGTGLNGFVPVTGLKVVIGNIFLENCTTAARTANVIPNAALITRFDFTCSGGGVLNIDKCNMAWYLSASQAYSVTLSNSGFIDAILLSEVATAMTITKVGVGNKPTTALATVPLVLTFCYAGGTVTDCVWCRPTSAAAGDHLSTISDAANFTFTRNTFRSNTIRGNVVTYSVNATRLVNSSFVEPKLVSGGSINLITCDTVNVTNPTYIEAVVGTTPTTYATVVYNISLNTLNCIFSGLLLPVVNNQPYGAILAAATGCNKIKLRNIGAYGTFLDLGTTNATGLIYSLLSGCYDIRVQRIYPTNTRTGIMTGDNSSTRVIEENVWGDYSDAVDVMACLNHTRKGMGGTGALTAQVSVYGTHWRDGFTSTLAGRIALLMNEATAATTTQVTLSGGSAFTSAGGLYMPTVGQSVIFETPDYLLGHVSFANSALVMAGGTATNYTYEYSIDKNDGAGYSTMTAALYTAITLGTALSGITGINAALGFKFKLKITTGTVNTTPITSVYVTTVSSVIAQGYQYPIDQVTTTLTSNVSLTGAEIRIYDLDNLPAGSLGSELKGVESLTGSFTFTTNASNNVWIQIIQTGYQEYGQSYTVASLDNTLSVILSQELNN